MCVAVHEASDSDVHQDPLGIHRVDHPERVVEALPATQSAAHGVPTAPRYVVAEYGQEGGIHHQVLGNPHPHGHTAVVHGRVLGLDAATHQATFQVGRHGTRGTTAGKQRTVEGRRSVRRRYPYS